MLALQGPRWADALRPLAATPIAFSLDYFEIAEDVIAGVPCLIAVQPSRSTAGATSFAYYAAASLPLIGVSKVYWPSNEAAAVLMCKVPRNGVERERCEPRAMPGARVTC